MKKNYPSKKVLQTLQLFIILLSTNLFAQVGIGTTAPNASSILDLTSSTQGFLTPRMTTAERNAIASPADGLMVYDTDLKSMFHFNSSGSAWSKINTESNIGRTKFKRIKSTDVLATALAAEKAAGGQTKYLLDASTLYEINGTIALDLPIELNNAYVIGQDSGEDKLVQATGDLFVGTTGGSVKMLTLTATTGKVFNMTGGGTQNFIFRDAIIAASANVGTIDAFSLVFISTVQFSGNTTGIKYKDISKLLINNAGWWGNNLGTYETLEGTFGLVTKTGGFTEVNGTSIGLDVSTNPTITNDALLESVVFEGTNTASYVKGYTSGSYTGYNFSNKWNVRSSGIPVEGDNVAAGDVNFDYAIGSGVATSISGTGSPVKLAGTTTSANLFRFSTGGVDNRLVYLGTKKRYFRAAATFSFQSSTSSAGVFIFYVAKNGVVINQSKVYCGVSSSDIDAATILTKVELLPNDYLEAWVSRYSGSGNVLTVSLNLVVN